MKTVLWQVQDKFCSAIWFTVETESVANMYLANGHKVRTLGVIAEYQLEGGGIETSKVN